jgi:hypothetical protein
VSGSGQAPAAADPRPKALAVPELDQFSPPDVARRAVAGWRSTTVEVIPGADHFLATGCREVVGRVLAWLGSNFGGPAPRPPG